MSVLTTMMLAFICKAGNPLHLAAKRSSQGFYLNIHPARRKKSRRLKRKRNLLHCSNH